MTQFKESEVVNVISTSSSVAGSGPIDMYDPLLGDKKKKKTKMQRRTDAAKKYLKSSKKK